MNKRDVLKDYKDIKNSFNQVIKANTKLSDEKQLVLKENERLKNIIDKALRYLDSTDKILKDELTEILEDNFLKEEE